MARLPLRAVTFSSRMLWKIIFHKFLIYNGINQCVHCTFYCISFHSWIIVYRLATTAMRTYQYYSFYSFVYISFGVNYYKFNIWSWIFVLIKSDRFNFNNYIVFVCLYVRKIKKTVENNIMYLMDLPRGKIISLWLKVIIFQCSIFFFRFSS